MLCNKQVLFNSASLKAIKAKCCRNLNIVRNEYKITLIYIDLSLPSTYIPLYDLYMLVRFERYSTAMPFTLKQTTSSRNIWSLLKLWWRSKTPPNNKFTTNDGVFRCGAVSRWYILILPRNTWKKIHPFTSVHPSMRRSHPFIRGLTGVFSQEFRRLLSF